MHPGFHFFEAPSDDFEVKLNMKVASESKEIFGTEGLLEH